MFGSGVGILLTVVEKLAEVIDDIHKACYVPNISVRRADRIHRSLG